MLRASIEYHGEEGDLRAVTEGAKAGDGGVAQGALLSGFAEAAVAGDRAALTMAREDVRAGMGSAALVDAAGVIANFQRMVRIADGAGIELDAVMVGASDDFREELGIEDFVSRRKPQQGLAGRWLAPVLRQVAKLGLRRAGRVHRSRESR